MLGAGVAATAVGALAGTAAPAAAAPRGSQGGQQRRVSGLPFTAIAPVAVTVDDVTVPRGYDWEPVIRWGDPILKGAPAFDAENQSPEAQAGQFGYNNDYLDIIETNRQGTRGAPGRATTSTPTRKSCSRRAPTRSA